jgi:hypothetical protein
MSNVQIVKLTTGEEIIADISEAEIDTQQFIIMSKPAIIFMQPKGDSETEFGVGLAPYAPFAKEHKVPIFPSHVVSLYEPEIQLKNEYNKRYGSGIIQPDLINKKVLNETIKGK